IMSSPAGFQLSQADFLARWMPSSTRAGVILNPCPGFSGSLRSTSSARESLSPEPDRSFASNFAPLPASADSSCLWVDGCPHSPGGETAGTDGPVNGQSTLPYRNSDGELDSLDVMESQTQDLPVMMKLEQLRKWQQHMQEQLKANQLEEMIRLQEEHQRLLGMMNGPQASVAVAAPPKRAFLKRGEGLSRFTNNRKGLLSRMQEKKDPIPPLQTRVITHSNSEPAAIQRGSTNGVQKLPVQRKTAILNKEKRQKAVSSPPWDTSVESKAAQTKVLGSHQRQNTVGSESIQTDTEGIKTKPHHPSEVKEHNNRKPNPVTKQRERGGGVPQDSFELSFQEKVHRWECDRQLESMELGEFELLEQAAEELSFSSNSSFTFYLEHPRRLSSTPIKSLPRGALQRCNSLGSSGFTECKGSSMNSDAFMVREDVLKKKVSIEDAEEDKHTNSDVSSCGRSDFEVQEVVVNPPMFPSTLCFRAQSDHLYDKRSYQDEDSRRDSASEVTQDDDAESDSVLSDADSTLAEDRQLDRVVFDDNDTWNDLEDTAVHIPNDSRGVSKRTLLRKIAVSKAAELDKGKTISSANQEPNPPPASQLMTKLFPSLKPKAQNVPLPPPHPAHHQSRLLRERLVELEIEIETFKKENAALTKLRQENEKNQETLRKERLEFEQMKAEELAKFEEYKKEESRKLQRERKLFEKHASAARAIPDKKEREEIQALKQQLSSVQEELRGKESRWASTQIRLRQQIDSLRQDNASLRDEICMMEMLRLSVWRKTPISAERDKEMTVGPKIPENTLSSVTKGVKFAVSMVIRFAFDHIHIETVLDSGDRLIVFPNGTRKEVSADGQTVKVIFFNGDTKEIIADQRVIYYYAEAQTTHITYPDGMEVLHFPNNQTEKHFPDGRKEITFPDQTVKNLFPNGREESVFTDGTIIQVNPDGTKEIHFNTGQREIHTADYKRREYPDGTVKTVYADGRQETCYPTGRLRIKDKDGNVVVDNKA
uniref:Uncharacterized protein n=1 Tax=Mola mola TaxID=94237 RepID=A0A3Q3XMZ8_MOLML